MGDSQDDHPRRKSMVSLSTPKTVECRRVSTTAALTTIHIPSVFDLTAFVGVGEPGGISLEISIPQTRQKPESRASFAQSALPPLPTTPLLWWLKYGEWRGRTFQYCCREHRKLTTVMRYVKRSPSSEHMEVVKEASLQDGLRVPLPLGLKLHRVM